MSVDLSRYLVTYRRSEGCYNFCNFNDRKAQYAFRFNDPELQYNGKQVLHASTLCEIEGKYDTDPGEVCEALDNAIASQSAYLYSSDSGLWDAIAVWFQKNREAIDYAETQKRIVENEKRIQELTDSTERMKRSLAAYIEQHEQVTQ